MLKIQKNLKDIYHNELIKIIAVSCQPVKLSFSNLVPLGSIFWQRTTAASFEYRESQREDISLRQITIVFAQYLLRQIPTVPFVLELLDVCDGCDMAKIANFVHNLLAKVVVILMSKNTFARDEDILGLDV